MEKTFDRATLETDDDDSGFPPAEPTSFSPRVSVRPSAEFEQGFFAAKQASLVPAFPTLPAPPRRKVSPERLQFAKLLFATLFGSIALLLGYALLQHVG